MQIAPTLAVRVRRMPHAAKLWVPWLLLIYYTRNWNEFRLTDRIQNYDEGLTKTRLFSCESVRPTIEQTGEEVFRRLFFYPTMDATFTSLHERFHEMHAFKQDFRFILVNMHARIRWD